MSRLVSQNHFTYRSIAPYKLPCQTNFSSNNKQMTAANQNRAGLIDVWKGIDCEITCIQDSCNVLSPGRLL